MRLSLITTVRDEATTVEALARAVAAQTRRPDEWVVVDGGSRDGTLERLTHAAAALGLPLRTAHVRGNIAQGRNAALRACGGELVIVTDGGCVPGPRWIERLVEPLAAAHCDVSAGPTVPHLGTAFDVAQWTLLDQLFSPAVAWRAPTISSRSLAFRRERAIACPYPEWLEHGEDRWLIDEWSRQGARVRVLDDADAAVAWPLRPSVAAFLRQHFLYMRGDGRARLRRGRNAARFGFYAALAGGVGLGYAPAAGLAWGAYAAVTAAVRWPDARRGLGLGVSARSLLWLPVLLAGMDAAKMAGYATGCAERGRRPA